MIDNANLQRRTQLIEAGFWGEDEPGDPFIEMQASFTVLARIEQRLNGTISISSFEPSVSLLRKARITIKCEGSTVPIGEGENYSETICMAAINLADFLRTHPEYRVRNGEETNIDYKG